MKRSKVGIALLVIGIVLIIFAPIWKWGIGPMFVKIPDDVSIKSVYEGTLTRFVDPASLALLSPEMAVTIPLLITRTDKSQPKISTGKVAVIREDMRALGPDGKTFLEYEKYFALDRKTGENVSGNHSDADRTGWFLLLPMGAKKITYKMWDDDTRKAGDATFEKTMVSSGNKHKNVQLYVFKASGTDKLVNPPFGLPAELSGQEIKSILNVPTLALSDTEMYPAEYEKKTEATIVAEPRTGTIVNLPSYKEEYYVDASSLGMGKIKIATIDYRQTEESVRNVIDDAGKYFSLLDLATLWVPLIVLILGVIIAAIGAFLTFRPAAKK